ncbi:hypothetical protein, variant 1 [Aphanomyces astaci]|uniref:Uncharacterized protein n=1 Tax=Aphanomyces astaci TaxID=112090 RepID=W4H6B2_APHAT|nr:hypothetical protein H257_01891 [Aphanomyces astaci]XP_009823633.1 hypothetical protein, variant 2 [Aphanomyces astaci]XP_009823634.1 hypothetical protein, variant 3 [Aphanomyces astaci]XP_009823635.1 hypothetical protein, variant 1 [Aphanomyces astaci]ETV86833.1 hypothetical protein H257_01891 [Aphanomyces astaci]ETV86834.1 hypothetical protein, variant 1 [Aphanomyces astaci]ETV86835.1 hypothetical protein, variant 2 [Aphanomyces astaci]ETV86836.1 hypothetical protein, variant 3 [Aphanom|eukprot:XP_009823632.1 hypothetical protein H257_01891 [Aphanomyces astaci]
MSGEGARRRSLGRPTATGRCDDINKPKSDGCRHGDRVTHHYSRGLRFSEFAGHVRNPAKDVWGWCCVADRSVACMRVLELYFLSMMTSEGLFEGGCVRVARCSMLKFLRRYICFLSQLARRAPTLRQHPPHQTMESNDDYFEKA